jgi:manganese/zinc/iron transport system substrate-binding protein
MNPLGIQPTKTEIGSAIHTANNPYRWISLLLTFKLRYYAVALLLLIGAPLQAQQRTPLKIVATTGIIADTARALVGHDAIVESLMGAGVDPHLFKASPRDVRLLTHADLILHNGLHLEGKLSYVLEKLKSRRAVAELSSAIAPSQLIPSGADTFDPHFWFDPILWGTSASVIRDALTSLDPNNAQHYSQRYQTLLSELRELDQWCRERLAAIPAERRVLITAHDAFAYLGRAYRIEVIGVQGINTESEASLRSINSLVKTITDRRLPAIFIESTVSPKTVQALINGARARGHTLALGGELYSDALGESGSGADTYQGMIKHNIETITEALSRGGTR